MKMKGLWSAGIKPTLIETFLPGLIFILALYVWQPGNLIQLGWMYIISLFPDVWVWMWPAYRLKRMEKGRKLWGWASFLVLYVVIYLLLTWWADVVINQLPIMKMVPLEELNLQEEILLYLIIIVVTLVFFSVFRLLFWLMKMICSWSARKIVRQLTFSHVSMFVLLAWVSIMMFFLYNLTISLPKFIRGDAETKQVAEWAAPILSSPSLKQQIEGWVKELEKKKWDSGMYDLPGYTIHRKWRVYNGQGEWLAGDEAKRNDQPLVEHVLRHHHFSKMTIVEGSKYLTAAPIIGSGEKMIGVVVQEREAEPSYFIDFTILMSLLFLFLSTPAILVITVIVFGFALFFAYLRAKQLNLRIQNVADAAKIWSSGNLLKRIKDEQKDELGVLSDQLNQVAASLMITTEKLAKEKQLVESLLQSKRELVANVSHELRTPITILRGHLDLWEREEDPEKTGKRVQILKQELIRLQSMIDELFAMATKDDRKPLEEMIELVPTQISPLLQELHDSFFHIAWREKKISMSLEVEDDLPSILVDAMRLRQVISNLLRNAIQHTPEGGMIGLKGFTEKDEVKIEVMDTGAGICPEELPHVFERYYRGNVVQGKYSGAGIGLYLAKTWVEHMGGEIRVESAEGEGTRITLIFSLSSNFKIGAEDDSMS